jgi:RNA polymerase sigma-70 factor (ECF subfamily)
MGGVTVNNIELTEKFHDIRNGDKTAFDELYQDMQTPIFTIISRITWDKSISEDIMQEVFVKLFLSPPEPSIKNPRAYVFQMARNLAINSMKKQPHHISLDEISETVHQPLDDFLLRMDIDDALKSLPSEECQIVTLRIIGELKFREISEIMKIPLGTALWKYQKAIAKLQKIIAGGPQ